MTHRSWPYRLRSLFKGTPRKQTKQTKQTRRPKVLVEPLEDRIAPAITAFSSGVLSLSLNFANEAVTLSHDGTNITISSTQTLTGAGTSFSSSAVHKIIVTDSGAMSGQSFTFAAGTAISLSDGLSNTGVETVTFNNTIDASSGSSAISVAASTAIVTNANLTAGSGGVSLTAGNISGNGLITATTVDLTATTGIASRLSAASISAASTNGNITITNAIATSVTNLSTGTGSITFNNLSGDASFYTTSTTNGSISLSTIGGQLTIVSPTVAGGSGSDISLSSNSSIFVDNSLQAADAITVNSGGPLDVSGAGNITAGGSVTLKSGAQGIYTGGDITTSGGLVNFQSATVFVRPIVINTTANGATGGSVDFDSTVTGVNNDTNSLEITAGSTGDVNFDAQIAGDLTLTALRFLSANSVTTASAISAYALNIGSGVRNFTTTGTGGTITTAVTFSNTGTLTLGKAGGTQTFAGGITATAPSSVSLSGTLASTGANIFIGDGGTPVTLNADTTLSSASGDITLGGTVNSVFGLVLNSTGTSTLGGTSTLASLTTNAGGTTVLSAGAITTGGAQTYNDAVTLGANTTLTSGSGNITLGGTVNGAFDLTLNTTGTSTLAGIVGGTTALASLATDDGGTTVISGGTITTSGRQTYLDALTLAADTTLAAGDIYLSRTVNGAFALTLNSSGTTSFFGVVGGTTALASLTTDAGGTTLFGAVLLDPSVGTIRTSGAQTYNDAVTLGNVTGLSTNTNGAFTFNGTLDGNYDLQISNDGTANVSFGAAVGSITPLRSLDISAANNVSAVAFRVGEFVMNTYGTTTFNGPVVTTTASTESTLPSFLIRGGTKVSVNSTITAAGDVNLGAATLSIASAGDITAAGRVYLGASTGISTAGDITSNGNQIEFDGQVTLTGNIAVATTGNGSTTGANVTFHGFINADNASNHRSLTLDAGTAGTLELYGPVGTDSTNALNVLTITQSGGATFYNSVNAATAAITDTADGQTVAFQGSLTVGTGMTVPANGAFNVSLTGFNNSIAGTTTFNNTGTLTLGSSNSTTTFTGGITATAPSSISLGGTIAFTNTNISIGDSSTQVTLNANTTLASGTGNITFGNTVNGAFALTLNSTGTTTLTTAIGASTPLASLTTDAAGTTIFNGGTVTTSGAQTYNDAVTLGADTTLLTNTGGALSFNGTLDGSHLLKINTNGTGDVSFAAAVGSNSALTGLDIRNANNLTTTALRATDLFLSAKGTTTFNAPVISTTGDVTVISKHIAVNGSVTSANNVSLYAQTGTLTIASAGDITAAGSVQLLGLTSIRTAGDLTSNGSSITAFGNVTLTGSISVASTGNNNTTGANIAFYGSINADNVSNQRSLTLDAGTGGTLSIAGAVGTATSKALDVLTITQSGGATFLDAVQAATVAITDTANGQTVAFQGNLALSTGMTVAANGAYHVSITGSLNSIAGTTTFHNTGNVTLGDAAGDSLLFSAGLTATDPSSASLAGKIASTDANISIGTDNTLTTLNAATILSSGAGNLTLGGNVNGAFTLTLNSTGATTLNCGIGTLTALASLTTDTGGNTALNIGTIITDGDQSYNDSVTLGTITGLSTKNNGTIAFHGTLDGNHSLTITADGTGNVWFGSPVGSETELGGLYIRSAKNMTAVALKTTDLAMSATGTTTFNGPVAITNGSIVVNGNDIAVNDTISSAISVGLNADRSDSATLRIARAGDITAAGSVSLYGLNGIHTAGDVTSNGSAIKFDGNVTLTGNVSVATTGNDSSNGANITFAGFINADDVSNHRSLTLDAGTAGTLSVAGAVGTATKALDVLTITQSGGATFPNPVNAATLAITDTADGHTIAFQSDLTIATAMTIAANGAYHVSITGEFISIAGSTTFNNTGTLTLGTSYGNTTFTGGLTATAPSSVSLAGTIASTDTNISIGDSTTPVALNADITLSPGSGNILLAGAISGAFGLTLNSTGTLTLAGTNTYTGDTILADGTLVLTGSLPASNLLLQGGTFQANGSVHNLTATGGTYTVSIDGLNAGTQHSQVTAPSVSLGGILNLVTTNPSFNPTTGTHFTIIDNTSTNPVSGAFANLPEGGSLNLGSQAYTITYKGGPNGNDVQLIANKFIPTPLGPVVTDPFTLDPGVIVSSLKGSTAQIILSTVSDGLTAGTIQRIVPFSGYTGLISASALDRNGDGVPESLLVSKASPGNLSTVEIIDAATGKQVMEFNAFGNKFKGGARVTSGLTTINGSTRSVFAVASGPGSASTVKMYDSLTGDLIKSFNPFSASYRDGVDVAMASQTTNGPSTLAVVSLANSTVRIFDLNNPAARVVSFQAFHQQPASANRIAVGDLNGDGVNELIVSVGDITAPAMRVYNLAGKRLAQFTPFPKESTGGMNVTLADYNHDGRLDIVTASQNVATARVRAFRPSGTPGLSDFRLTSALTFATAGSSGTFTVV